jgi:dipeptidyl aminopeptidase/acylaminoacyl peptidase
MECGGHRRKLITFTTRFKARLPGRCANWLSLRSSDASTIMAQRISMAEQCHPTYWDHSAKFVRSALPRCLIGENDPRIPPAQPLEMFRALRAQGVPAELHIAPGEGHIWLRPAHQLHKMNAETEWFERHVRNIPYAPEPIPARNDPAVVPTP